MSVHIFCICKVEIIKGQFKIPCYCSCLLSSRSCWHLLWPLCILPSAAVAKKISDAKLKEEESYLAGEAMKVKYCNG